MGVNKVVFGVVSIMDISDSTVTPETLVKGSTAYDKSGEKIEGTNPYAKVETDTIVDEQTDLINQIATVLEGKASGGVGETITIVNNTDNLMFIGGYCCYPYESVVVPYPNNFLCTFFAIGDQPCNAHFVVDGEEWSSSIMLTNGHEFAGYFDTVYPAGTTITFEPD